MTKKILCGALIACALLFFLPLSRDDNRPTLYGTELGDDLKRQTLKAIHSAKRSINAATFHLEDPDIVEALNAKANQGVFVSLYLDRSSPKVPNLSPRIQLIKKKGRGLMHRKILVIDKRQVLIGSANLTRGSLRLHHNLMMKIPSKKLARFLLNPRTPSFKDKGQSIYLLPNKEAKRDLLASIEKTQRTLKAALFTFTDLELAKALGEKASSGIRTQVIIGLDSAHTALGEKVIAILENGGAEVRVCSSPQLLHHKLLILDDDTLVIGSANWTKAAFTHNEEIIAILKGHTLVSRALWPKVWNLGK